MNVFRSSIICGSNPYAPFNVQAYEAWVEQRIDYLVGLESIIHYDQFVTLMTVNGMRY